MRLLVRAGNPARTTKDVYVVFVFSLFSFEGVVFFVPCGRVNKLSQDIVSRIPGMNIAWIKLSQFSHDLLNTF